MSQRAKMLLGCGLIVTLLLSSSVSCERRDAGAPGGSRQDADLPGGVASPALTVTILPESPTLSTDLQAVCSRTDGIRYRWEQNGQVLQGEEGAILTAGRRFSKGDTIMVTARDQRVAASATVTIGNTPPTVTSITLTPEVVSRGIDISATPAGHDADGDPVQFVYAWSVNGNELPDAGAVLRGDRFKRGDRVSLSVTPSDGEGTGAPMMTSPILVQNAPPRFVSTPPSSFQSDVYRYEAQAEDPDNDLLTYSLLAAPPGMSINAQSGTIILEITREHAGSHQIEIAVQDPFGARATQSYSILLNIP
jgi:hypothetical protein